MDQITLRVPVTVKAKVTPALKEKILKNVEQTLADIDREMQNLEDQAKRMMAEQAKIDAQGLISLRAQVEEQKQRLMAARTKGVADKDAAMQLAIGSEIVQGTTEQMVEVKIGDDLDALTGVEVLLEDGKIIAIRR
ncbi:YlqD family protein [uncultured Megasphaera sp.]|uniref:YlqD family protein n=1 Tax=uncultured Megasphaera sp. TaxID=165188 RepID=UPI0025923F4C|nr:YlqD family protein [uncultured Megasphaera sp.]